MEDIKEYVTISRNSYDELNQKIEDMSRAIRKYILKMQYRDYTKLGRVAPETMNQLKELNETVGATGTEILNKWLGQDI